MGTTLSNRGVNVLGWSDRHIHEDTDSGHFDFSNIQKGIINLALLGRNDYNALLESGDDRIVSINFEPTKVVIDILENHPHQLNSILKMTAAVARVGYTIVAMPNDHLLRLSEVVNDDGGILFTHKGGDPLNQQLSSSYLTRQLLLANSKTEQNDPFEGGRKLIDMLKKMEGGAYSPGEARRELGICRQSLKERRDSGTIVSWQDSQGHFHYPKWQFDKNNQVYDGILRCLKEMEYSDTWGIMGFFLLPEEGATESPLDLIKGNSVDVAIELARRHAPVD